MECRNILCIYYEEGFCSLNEIEINELGMCYDCIIVDIPEEYLQQKREEALLKLKNITYTDTPYTSDTVIFNINILVIYMCIKYQVAGNHVII